MKKFGTPIGAGPGSESEKVGLLVPGTPLPDGRAAFGLAFLGAAAPGEVTVCGCVDGFCFLAGFPDNGFGVVPDDEVEVEVEVVLDELEVEVEVVVEEPEDEIDVVVVVVLVEVEEVGVQVSVSDTTTPVTGRFRLETGVPGGTLT
ncbi:MAG: hypothetical protein WCB67_06040 [Solirubrobacteraceae bacterium]